MRQGTLQLGKLPLHDTKPATGYFARQLEIKLPQCLAEICMIFGFKRQRGGRSPGQNFFVIVLVNTHRNRCIREVGCPHEQFV